MSLSILKRKKLKPYVSTRWPNMHFLQASSMFSLYFSSIFEPMRYSFRRVLFFSSHSSSISHNSENLKLLNQRLKTFIEGARINNKVLKRRGDESLGINASKFSHVIHEILQTTRRHQFQRGKRHWQITRIAIARLALLLVQDSWKWEYGNNPSRQPKTTVSSKICMSESESRIPNPQLCTLGSRIREDSWFCQ